MRQKERYGTISAVPAGSGVSSAAEREGRVGRRPSVLLHPSGGGAHGPEEFRAGLWRRRRSAILSGADVEGMAVCLRAGDHVGAAAGGAGIERRIHAGAGDGAADEAGTVGAGGDRLDADSGGGLAEPAGEGRAVAAGAEPAAAKHSQVAEAVR